MRLTNDWTEYFRRRRMMFDFGIEEIEPLIARCRYSGQPITGWWWKFRGIEPWLRGGPGRPGSAHDPMWEELVRSRGGLVYWRYWCGLYGDAPMTDHLCEHPACQLRTRRDMRFCSRHKNWRGRRRHELLEAWRLKRLALEGPASDDRR
jgi:hypothetical protein